MSPNSFHKWIHQGFITANLPVFLAISYTKATIGRANYFLKNKAQLIEQIEYLESENAKLRAMLLQIEVLKEENTRLQWLLSWKVTNQWNLLPARIIFRSIGEWWRELLIDKGANDGVRPDMAVISPNGLVGKINEVGPYTSTVVLLGSPRCKVAAMLLPDGEQGIITSSPGGTFEYGIVRLIYLPQNAQLWAGQVVVTSGIGGVFPPNLKIGTIIDWRSAEYGLHLEARVRLAVAINRLREVFIILQ